MNAGDLTALAPLVVTAAASIVVLLAIGVYRSHRLSVGLTLAGLGAALAALAPASKMAPRHVTALLVVDEYAIVYMGLILAAGLMVAMLSYGYLERREGRRGEFYVLLLLAVLGAAVLAASDHFASFFLGLEVLSVSLYGLIAYPRTGPAHIEAGVKYLVLGGTSSAFLLFGMALVYGELGTMQFSRIAEGAAALGGGGLSWMLMGGTAMLIVGIGFKLALVPFHLWTPDVYEGAPAPVTAFIATVSKGAVFALVLRYFTTVDVHKYESLAVLFSAVAVASMLAGNLLALLQTNLKRLLAYSSISHMGYVLVAFLAAGPSAAAAVTYYLAAYFVATLGAFGVVAVLSGGGRDADALEDYRGLAWRRPGAAGVLTATMLSLAGIPLTAGFVGKLYVLKAGVGSDLWLLVAVLAATSVIGLFYYLRVIRTLYWRPSGEEGADGAAWAAAIGRPLSPLETAALAALVILLVWLGAYPGPAIGVIEAAMAGLP
jgi:NADH-quinone oxidoreductase subunit N